MKIVEFAKNADPDEMADTEPPGPSCSKLTTLLVNVSLKFQTLRYAIYQYFLLKKCEKLVLFFQQKISVYLVIKL